MRNKNINGLINKIADLKDISSYSAKTDKNLLIKLIIKNTKNLLNKIGLDGNGYAFIFGFNNGYGWNTFYVEAYPKSSVSRLNETLRTEMELEDNFNIKETAEMISKDLVRKITENFSDFRKISKTIFKSSQKFVNFIANLPFDYSKINLKIGEKSKFSFIPEEWKMRFVFDEEDIPKEKILRYIENIFLNIGTFKENFSAIKFIGKNYTIEVKYIMNCYAVIKSQGLSAEQELEFLSFPGSVMDRVRFSGNFLQFDITQSKLIENLVDIQFQKENDFLCINKSKIEEISGTKNMLAEYFRKHKPDYLGNLFEKIWKREKGKMKRIKEIIIKIAETVSKEYHIPGSPMKETVEKMNIKIIKTDRIDEILNGTIRKNENHQFEIFIYLDGISEERENFVLARELGHLLLHIKTDIQKNNLPIKSLFNFSIEEKEEAELFAFSFLMPKIEFRQKFLETQKENYADLKTVARYFNVTIGKARQWAYQLKLLKW